MPLGILAQASWRANRRKRPRVVTRGKIRCHSGLRARARRSIVVLGRVSFRDGPFVRLVRHVSGKIDRVKRLPWRDAHMVVFPLLTPN
jgi:hypothetical protein